MTWLSSRDRKVSYKPSAGLSKTDVWGNARPTIPFTSYIDAKGLPVWRGGPATDAERGYMADQQSRSNPITGGGGYGYSGPSDVQRAMAQGVLLKNLKPAQPYQYEGLSAFRADPANAGGYGTDPANAGGYLSNGAGVWDAAGQFSNGVAGGNGIPALKVPQRQVGNYYGMQPISYAGSNQSANRIAAKGVVGGGASVNPVPGADGARTYYNGQLVGKNVQPKLQAGIPTPSQAEGGTSYAAGGPVNTDPARRLPRTALTRDPIKGMRLLGQVGDPTKGHAENSGTLKLKMDATPWEAPYDMDTRFGPYGKSYDDGGPVNYGIPASVAAKQAEEGDQGDLLSQSVAAVRAALAYTRQKFGVEGDGGPAAQPAGLPVGANESSPEMGRGLKRGTPGSSEPNTPMGMLPAGADETSPEMGNMPDMPALPTQPAAQPAGLPVGADESSTETAAKPSMPTLPSGNMAQVAGGIPASADETNNDNPSWDAISQALGNAGRKISSAASGATDTAVNAFNTIAPGGDPNGPVMQAGKWAGGKVKQVLGMLSGAGKAPDDVRMQAEANTGQKDPDARKIVAVGNAVKSGNMDAAASLMQGYRSMYDMYRSFAAAALKGTPQKPADIVSAARAATQAYGNLLDGKKAVFLPTNNGVVVKMQDVWGDTPIKQFDLTKEQFAQWLTQPHGTFDYAHDKGGEAILQQIAGKAGSTPSPVKGQPQLPASQINYHPDMSGAPAQAAPAAASGQQGDIPVGDPRLAGQWNKDDWKEAWRRYPRLSQNEQRYAYLDKTKAAREGSALENRKVDADFYKTDSEAANKRFQYRSYITREQIKASHDMRKVLDKAQIEAKTARQKMGMDLAGKALSAFDAVGAIKALADAGIPINTLVPKKLLDEINGLPPVQQRPAFPLKGGQDQPDGSVVYQGHKYVLGPSKKNPGQQAWVLSK